MKKLILLLLITGMLFPWISNVVIAQDQAGKVSGSVVPANDPKLTGPAVLLNKEAMSVHPRLLFGPKDLTRLKEFYNSDKGKPYKEGIEKMLPVCKAPEKPGFLMDRWAASGIMAYAYRFTALCPDRK